MKRKVVIVGSAYPLRGGGIATYNERLAKAFIDNGDELIIHSFKLQYPGFLFPGKTQYSTEPPPEGLDIRVTVNSINPFNWYKIGREIRKLKPELVIIRFWIPFMGPCLGTIARKIRKNKHTKVIAIADNIIPHEKKPLDKILIKYFVKSVDGFIFMSKSVLNDLNVFDKLKPRKYCPHPLYDNYGEAVTKEIARKQLKLDIASNYILFFGFIRDYKGLDILLEAFGDKRIKELPLKLLVAGEFYTDPKPYWDIIKKHDLNDDVFMTNDFIPNNEVVNYFCAADLIVQPYKDATQSGVTQAAYHFDKPMVVTNVGGLPEMIPHGKVGYVVPPDKDNIVDAICNFYNMKKEDEFVENVKQEKLKYSWDNMIEKIQELQEEL